MDRERAITWPNEQFTRLVIGRCGNDEQWKLIISFPPLRSIYDSAKDYKIFSLPIVQNEWLIYSDNFGSTNKTTGLNVNTILVEKIFEDGDPIPVQYFIIHAAISLNNFWNLENCQHIHAVTINTPCVRCVRDKHIVNF